MSELFGTPMEKWVHAQFHKIETETGVDADTVAEIIEKYEDAKEAELTKKSDEYQTTDEDFRYFVEQCRKWIDILSLHELDYYFAHQTTSDDARASFSSKYIGRKVRICLSKEWNYPATPETLEYCAFHEIVHTMFTALFAQTKVLFEEEAETREHEIINKLWKAFRGIKNV